jgi:hypothetical protein
VAIAVARYLSIVVIDGVCGTQMCDIFRVICNSYIKEL